MSHGEKKKKERFCPKRLCEWTDTQTPLLRLSSRVGGSTSRVRLASPQTQSSSSRWSFYRLARIKPRTRARGARCSRGCLFCCLDLYCGRWGMEKGVGGELEGSWRGVGFGEEVGARRPRNRREVTPSWRESWMEHLSVK